MQCGFEEAARCAQDNRIDGKTFVRLKPCDLMRPIARGGFGPPPLLLLLLLLLLLRLASASSILAWCSRLRTGMRAGLHHLQLLRLQAELDALSPQASGTDSGQQPDTADGEGEGRRQDAVELLLRHGFLGDADVQEIHLLGPHGARSSLLDKEGPGDALPPATDAADADLGSGHAGEATADGVVADETSLLPSAPTPSAVASEGQGAVGSGLDLNACPQDEPERALLPAADAAARDHHHHSDPSSLDSLAAGYADANEYAAPSQRTEQQAVGRAARQARYHPVAGLQDTDIFFAGAPRSLLSPQASRTNKVC